MPTDGNELSVPDLARMLDVRGKGYQADPVAKDPEEEEKRDFEEWETEIFPDVDIPGPPGPTPDSRADGAAAGKLVGEGVTPLDVIRKGDGVNRSGAARGAQRQADRSSRTM